MLVPQFLDLSLFYSIYWLLHMGICANLSLLRNWGNCPSPLSPPTFSPYFPHLLSSVITALFLLYIYWVCNSYILFKTKVKPFVLFLKIYSKTWKSLSFYHCKYIKIIYWRIREGNSPKLLKRECSKVKIK